MGFLNRQIARSIKKPVVWVLLFLTLSIVFTNVRADPTATWITKAPIPVNRADMPGISYNNLVYIFGGYQHSNGGGQAEVYAYNPSTDIWTQKASMNYARWGSAAALYDGIAYVFGGYDGGDDNKVEAYNFASNSWTTKNDLPDNLVGQGEEAVTVGSLIYVFGGWGGTGAYSYNPSTDSYTQLSDIPYSTRWATCAYVNVNGEDRIYIMGGYNNAVGDAVNNMYYYRPAFDDWVSAGTTPYTAYGMMKDDPVMGGLIYFGYGHAQGQFFSNLYSYNASTDTWTQLPQGTYPRDGVAFGIVNSNIYVIGGRNSLTSDIPGLNYNEQYASGLLSVSIIPTQVRMYVNQTQTFISSVSGGTTPYSYQWYLNSIAVPGATSGTWNFIPTQTGTYNVYLNVTDNLNSKVKSNIVNDIIVYNQSQESPLVPDWSNVTQDFFTLDPGTVEPVLTEASVTDRAADFVADPFMFHENGTWYMFFEVGQDDGQYSEIGLATSPDGFTWTYQQIVLSEPFAMAFPYVFKWEGHYYLMPETYSENEVRLYEATNFPYDWTFVNNIISGQSFNPVDSQIFRYNNLWWMFTGDDSDCYVFYSDNLTDPTAWHMTSYSPIITNDPSEVRGGGRTIVFDNGRIIRLTQMNNETYGQAVRAFEVDTINVTSFSEHEISQSPIVEATGGSSGWNWWAMHTVDPWWTGNGWIAAVDGGGDDWWTIGIYVSPLSTTISPIQVRMDLSQTRVFTASVFGGTPPYTYQWVLNGTAFSGATGSTWSFTPTQTGHYDIYVEVTDSFDNQVQSNIVTDVIVYNPPSVSISPSSPKITLGGSQQFSSTVSGGELPYTYQWYSNNTGVLGATSPTFNFTPNSVGTYNIFLNVTDNSTYRTQSNTVILRVYSQPSVTISPTAVNMTINAIQQFTSTVTGGLSPYTYQWYYINGTAITGAASSTLTFKANSTGTFNIYLNVTDSLNYKVESNSAVINVYSQPSVVISPVSVRMTVGTGQLFASSAVGGLVPYAYQWYLNDTAVLGATAATWNFVPTTIGHYRVYLNVTDALNVRVESNIVTDIIVNPQPTVTVTPTNVNMTVGGSQNFSSNIIGGTAPYSYQWYLNGSNASGAFSPNWIFTPTMAGTYVIYLKVTDGDNVAANSNSATINVYSQPSVSISPTSVSMTVGSTQLFTSSVAGGLVPYAYQWYLNSIAVSGANASTWNFTPTTAGAYNIYLNVTDSLNNQVQSNIATNILVYSSTSVFAINLQSGGSDYTTPAILITGGGGSGATATARVSNGVIYAIVLTNPGSGYTSAPTIIIRDPDPRAKGATATAVVGLSAATISPIHVKMDLGQSQTFNSTVSGGIAPYFYQWYLNDVAISDSNTQNWTFIPTATGNYTIYLNVTDALNFEVQSNIVTDITVYSQMTLSISPVSLNMTVGVSQTFDSIVSGGSQTYSYHWYLNGSAVSGATSSSWVFTPIINGTYNIFLTVTDNNNAVANSNTATVNVYLQLSATINPANVTLYFGQSQTFDASVTGGKAPYTYQWYFNGSLVPGATNINWTFVPKANGNYQIYVYVTDSLGAHDSSNLSSLTVFSVYLMLSTDQQTYSKGQQLIFTVTVLNQQNSRLETSLSLTITGPGGYCFYDFQPINVSANGVGEYIFTWTVPDAAGKYVVETNLAPAHLTAYDAKYIDVVESTGFASSQGNFASKSLASAIAVFVGSQVFVSVYSLRLSPRKGRKLQKLSRAWLKRCVIELQPSKSN